MKVIQPNKNIHRFAITMSAPEYRKLKKYAELNEISLSAVIEVILRLLLT